MLFKEFSKDLRIQARSDAPQRPRVSIVLPTYARAHGPLQRSIDSVLAQDFDDFELIAIDDGSRDGSAEVLQAYQRADPRVVIHHYHHNSGLPGLRVDQAALHAKAELIAYQFDDDLWLDGSLRRRVEALACSRAPAVVYGNALVLKHTDKGLVQQVLGGPFNFATLMGGNYIANNTVMHHRCLFDTVGMYDPHVSMRRLCDYDLWLRMARVADFIWIDETLSQVHANLEDSLGRVVPLSHDRYIKRTGSRRNAALQPQAIGEYDVLRLQAQQSGMSQRDVQAYYREDAVPFLAKYNDYCDLPTAQVVGAAEGRTLSLYVVKPDFSTSVDLTVGNFAELQNFGTVRYAFSVEANLTLLKPSEDDTVLLYRTVGSRATDWLLRADRPAPSAYLMDDNMLHFHAVGHQNAFLAPGTSAHANVVEQIKGADACLGYSEPIVQDMHEINPRTLRLQTNIPSRYVLDRCHRRGDKLRFAVLSGEGRKGIFGVLWPAIVQFAERHRDQVAFHFWGIDPADYAPLACEVECRPFTHSYERYMSALAQCTFDVLLAPLDDTTRAAQSKSPVKFLEGVAAGAVSILTDCQPYRDIPETCCIKVGNTVDQWQAALESVVALGAQGRERMLAEARALVGARYTTESAFYDFMAALRTVRLHRKIGTASILYVFHETALGGATLHLLLHAKLARSLGFSVVALAPSAPQWQDDFVQRWISATGNRDVVLDAWPSGYMDADSQRPPSDTMRVAANSLVRRLQAYSIGMVHFATWSPTMSLLSACLRVPAVGSVHAYYAGAESHVPGFADAIHCSSHTHGATWSKAACAAVMPIVCPTEERYFAIGSSRRLQESAHPRPIRLLVSGTLQIRKNQLAAIQALSVLRSRGVDATLDLLGYTELVPQYTLQCKAMAAQEGLEARVTFHGFVADPSPFYAGADVLMICATDESMPQTMLQAMAARVAVVTTRVGGVEELVRHRYSGFIASSIDGTALADAVMEYLQLPLPDRQEILDRAHRSISLVGRESYVRMKLVDLYTDAVQAHEQRYQQFPSPQRSLQAARLEEEMGGLAGLRASCMRDSTATAANRMDQDPLAASVTRELMDEVRQRLQAGTFVLPRTPGTQPVSAFAEWIGMLSGPGAGRHHGRGRALALSRDLREVPYEEYSLPRPAPGSNLLSVALFLPQASFEGWIGIEVVAPEQGIVMHEMVRMSSLRNRHSITLALPQAAVPTGAGWLFRVFAREVMVPVAVMERRRAGFGWWKRNKLPLAVVRPGAAGEHATPA